MIGRLYLWENNSHLELSLCKNRLLPSCFPKLDPLLPYVSLVLCHTKHTRIYVFLLYGTVTSPRLDQKLQSYLAKQTTNSDVHESDRSFFRLKAATKTYTHTVFVFAKNRWSYSGNKSLTWARVHFYLNWKILYVKESFQKIFTLSICDRFC